MNEGTVREVVAALSAVYRQHEFSDDAARGAHDMTLSRLLSHVPEPNSWTVVRWGLGTALILADDLLFSLTVERISAEGHPDALLTSRWLEAHTASVSVRWDPEEQTEDGVGFTTHWTFHVGSGDPIAIVGFVHTQPRDELDRTEVFARALARKVGWRLAG